LPNIYLMRVALPIWDGRISPVFNVAEDNAGLECSNVERWKK